MKRVIVACAVLVILTACMGLPAGVTLRDLDGGAHPYASFSSGFPDDPAFFPVGGFNWNENGQTGNTSAAWVAAGLNFVWNFYDAPNIPEVNASGLYSVVKPDTLTMPGPGYAGLNRIVGYIPGDEPDGNAAVYCTHVPSWAVANCHGDANNRTNPDSLSYEVQTEHAQDSTRLATALYTKPVAIGQGLYDPNRAPYLVGATGPDCSGTCLGPDVASYDYYPMTDTFENGHGTPAVYSHWWDQCDAVNGMRDRANHLHPIMPVIETNSQLTSASFAYDPTPDQITAEVWTALACGAQGVVYFKNNLDDRFAPTHPHTIDIFSDSHYTSTVAELTKTNADIKAMAKILNAPYADGFTTVSGCSVHTMTKYAMSRFWVTLVPTYNTPNDPSQAGTPQTCTVHTVGVTDTGNGSGQNGNGFKVDVFSSITHAHTQTSIIGNTVTVNLGGTEAIVLGIG